MAEAKKRERNFERSYSDSTGEISISHNDDTVAVVVVSEINSDVMRRAAMRYLTDILVGVGNAALKAEGGTAESAQEKMDATLQTLKDGTFKFRAASGDGGLSLEDEQEIIIKAAAALKGVSLDESRAKVLEIYNRTKVNKKGYTVRPDYNQLKAVPKIKAALAEASSQGDNLNTVWG